MKISIKVILSNEKNANYFGRIIYGIFFFTHRHLHPSLNCTSERRVELCTTKNARQ
jgi:hypothetical protein